MKKFSMVFKCDKQLLEKMLELRRRGWTYKSLAFLFNVDHSSIYKWCKIRGIGVPSDKISIDVSDVISLFRYRTPHVKTYKEYLEESQKRYRGRPNESRLLKVI